MKRNAGREEEIMRSKEATIEANSKHMEAKEMEINKLKIELDHQRVKVESHKMAATEQLRYGSSAYLAH